MSEEKPLVGFSRDKNLSDLENHDKFVESVKRDIRTITVEPILAFIVIIAYLQSYVSGQYIYYRIQKDYNIIPNDTRAYVCTPDQNHTDEAATDRIQSINAQYTTYIQLSLCVTTILTAPFYCVFSDRYGRKIMFFIPSVGIFLKSVFEVLIILYNWPIYVFVITEGMYGFFGGTVFLTSLSYSYVADISTQKMRTKRMAILDIVMAIGAIVISLSVGFWIKYVGYLSPQICSAYVSAINLLYCVFLLEEPPKMPQVTSKIIPPMQQFKRLFTIFSHRPKSQKALLIIIMVMFNFYYVSEMSTLALANTYLMSYPICMNSVEMSIFGSLNTLVVNTGVGISVVILAKWFNDLPLVLVGLLSGLSFAFQMAYSITKTQVYIAAATNLLSFSAFPFIRGYLSKRVGHEEQGALFGGFALSEAFCSAITKVATIYFYGETFLIFHGMVYFFIAGFSLIAILLTIIAIPLDRNMDISGFLTNKDDV